MIPNNAFQEAIERQPPASELILNSLEKLKDIRGMCDSLENVIDPRPRAALDKAPEVGGIVQNLNRLQIELRYIQETLNHLCDMVGR